MPIGRKTFDLENHVELVDDLSQFKDKNVKVLKDIMGKCTDDDLFKRAFLLYVLSQFLCPTSKNEASLKLLNTIVDVNDPSQFNWAKLILDLLVKEIKTYTKKLEKDSSKTTSIGGCVLFLKVEHDINKCRAFTILCLTSSYHINHNHDIFLCISDILLPQMSRRLCESWCRRTNNQELDTRTY